MEQPIDRASDGSARYSGFVRMLKPWLWRYARPALEARFGEDRAGGILDAAFAGYSREALALQPEPSVGGTVMLHCAALTAALYRVLLEHALEPAEARALVAGVTAAVYDRMAGLPWLVARLSARSPLVRLRRATDTFRTFPFSAPAYSMKDVPADELTVAFDVERCPVARYMRAHDLAELCVESWCNLDFALADKWGASLERSTTLAGGADRCDFRWHLKRPA